MVVGADGTGWLGLPKEECCVLVECCHSLLSMGNKIEGRMSTAAIVNFL